MVANYRCNEMKEEAYNNVKPVIEKLKLASTQSVMEKFGEKCEQIVSGACNVFREAAKQYNKDVFEKVLAELKELIHGNLYLCFDAQLSKIRQHTYDKVTTEIKKLQTKPLEEVADQLNAILKALLSTNIESYTSKAQSLLIEASGWDEAVALHTTNLKQQLDTLAQGCKDKLLTEVSRRATKAHEDKIKEVLHSTLSDMNDNLAVTLKDTYVEQVETFNENLHDILKRGFGMARDEVFEFLGQSEKMAHEYCLSELKIVFRQSANQNLFRKFNDTFKKDEAGKRRDWREMEEGKIKEIWDDSKKKIEVVMEQFKRIYFPTGLTKMDQSLSDDEADAHNQSTPSMEDLIRQNQQEMPVTDQFRRSRTSISISSIRVLPDEDITRVKEKLLEEIDFAFDEAIRAHVSCRFDWLILNLCFARVEKHFRYFCAYLALGCPCMVRL